MARTESKPSALPRAIWALGFTSLLMDLSSEMIHGLLPLYVTTVMGAGAIAVGLIEGVAEATALIVRVVSGTLSDRLGRPKLLALLGYGLAAVTKPVFPLAPTLGFVVAARFVDRIGKGIRGAPRDALVADITPPEQRGAAYGLRQSLDTVGAFLGPLVAVVVMLATANAFTTVFWLAVIPAFAAVAVLALFVPERRPVPGEKRRDPFALAAASALPRAFWAVSLIAALLSFARISEAFLVLRASQSGLPVAYAPLVLVAMNIVYAAGAYPAGVLADRLSRPALLAAGIVALIGSGLALGLSAAPWAILTGLLLWGLHMALTQGVMAAMVADAAPADLRGTAFGFFYLASGVALLAGNLLAGYLWDTTGASATYLASAAAAAVTLALLPIVTRTRVAAP